MTREEKLMFATNRYNVLKEREKVQKAPGVLRKLRRQIRNLEK
jgi:hypothetical protein